MIDKWEIRSGSDPLGFYLQYLNETTSEVWGEFPEFLRERLFLISQKQFKTIHLENNDLALSSHN